MATPNANIVQAEFFHVGGDQTPSLEALFAECGERLSDGLELVLQGHEPYSRIKTVVRFFDESGVLTNLALKAERLKKQDKELLDNFVRASGLRRWFLDRRSRRLAAQTLTLREDARVLAADQLCKTLQARREIAVERSDHSFRIAKKDETHELAESAHRSKGVWLFVFQPNNLLADTNTSVASLM